MSTVTHMHQPLVERCRVGDRRAQEEIYRLYAKPMLNVSMRILNDRFEAEDTLQESFVSAFQGIGKFKQQSSFGSWFKRIVINKSLNKVKKRRIQFRELHENIAEPVIEEEAPHSSLSVEEIKQAVRSLPDGFRIVFSLYMFEDLSHKEIASHLGITESTSKSQLHRAKKELRKSLSHG